MNRLTICIFCFIISTSISAQSEFITTWKTVSPNESITITINPSIGAALVKYDVDWGDGQSDIEVAGSISHIYATPGDHSVKVTGSLPGIQVNVPQGNASKLININQWGAMPWVTMRDAFRDANKLTIDATDAPDLSLVTNSSRMFLNCVNLNSSIGHWDVSDIENMSEMFAGCKIFNQDLSDWDVINVSSMNEMFNGASDFDQSLGQWEIIQVEEMSDMLVNTDMSQANYDNTIIGWANYAAGQGAVQMGVELGVTGLQYCLSESERQELINNYNWIFDGDIRVCRDEAFIVTLGVRASIASIFIITNSDYDYNYMVDWENDGIIDEYNVTDNIQHAYITGEYEMAIYGEFPHFLANGNFGSTGFVELTDINQWGAIAWKSMEGSFANHTLSEYSALDAPDLSDVNSMERMFLNCTSFNGDIVDWDVSHVKNMSQLFYEATIFNRDIGSWDVDSVTDMSNMFYDASSFNGDITGWSVGSVTDMSEMFYNATSFNGSIGGWDVSNVTDMSSMFRGANQFNFSLAGWEVGNVTSMSDMFSGAESFNQYLNSWDVSNVTTMRGMFQGAAAFNQALDSFDIVHLTDLSYMFDGASSFNQPLNTWHTENVTTMEAMFQGADVFNQDISNWNTPQVTNMSYMFYDSESFNQPVGDWVTSNVMTFYSMFEDALAFDQSLGDWDITNSEEMDYILSNSSISRENYDATLIAWSQQVVNNDIYITSDHLLYCQGKDARQSLIDDHGWIFIGDTEDCNGLFACTSPTVNNYIGPDTGDWHTATNWSQGSIPDECDHVLIGTDKSVSLSGDAECYLIDVFLGSSLTVDGHQLTISAEISN